MPAGRNIKKALKETDLNKLLTHQPAETDMQKALDFWIFSYLCNGMNFADIIELKPLNISGNYLHFIREKTKRTKKKDLRPIKVGLNPKALEIIERQKNNDPKNPYLFPVLQTNLTPLTTKHRCKRFIKWVNVRMEKIRQELRHRTKNRHLCCPPFVLYRIEKKKVFLLNILRKRLDIAHKLLLKVIWTALRMM